MNNIAMEERKHVQNRRKLDKVVYLLFLLATSIGMFVLSVLIIDIIIDGTRYMRPELFTEYPSRHADKSGMLSAIVGSAYMLMIMAPIAFVLAVGAAIYLEEYARKNAVNRLIQVCISTLAGVPSIVYGMLGLTIFVHVMNLGNSLLAGALTMTLLVLPIIIVASQEAIKAVPGSRRDASFALGATKWQTTQNAVLPSAIPGILTGVILAMSRAIGETAPLIVVGAAAYVPFLPEDALDQFTVLPIQIYSWVGKPQTDFHDLAASGIIVLMAMLLLMNITAVIIRNKYSKRI